MDESNIQHMQRIHIFAEWFELGTTTTKLTVAILLSSGVFSGQRSVCVYEDRYALDFLVTWPNLFVSLAHLHRKWL